MNGKEDLLRMFAYDHWANRECLRALGTPADAHPNILRLLAHTVAAQKLWLERLRTQPQSGAVWPSSTLQDCTSLVDEMSIAWTSYLKQLPDAALNATIDYRTSKGERWTSRVEDVLIHVLMHSVYHRGQAALEMRAAGIQPPITDFVYAIRNGLVE
jgi:uncharacterized damage-inducible protein DinB